MTNFVFSRRSLQAAINDLAGVITPTQLAALVRKLNKVHDGRMAAMWEVVVLSALSKIGCLSHELELPNGRRPDFNMNVALSMQNEVNIIGDIATVSDNALHEQNPVEEFAEQLIRTAKKVRLRPEFIGFRVDSHRPKSGRLQLRLPKKGEIVHLIKAEVQPWMLQRAASPGLFDTFKFERGAVKFSIVYDPRQRNFNGGYLSYTCVTSLEKNTLAYALKNKADQLRASPATAIRMVVVCDSGASIFRDLVHRGLGGSFSAYEVAQKFLRESATVDLVLLVTVEQTGIQLSTPCEIRWATVARPRGKQPDRLWDLDFCLLGALLDKLIDGLPRPMRTPSNAARLCNDSDTGPCPFGGSEVSSDRVTLSARALQQLLSGNVTTDDFCERHGWGPEPNSLPNPFKQSLLHGRPIARIEVQPGGDRDDDSVTFFFGPSDSALGSFRVPASTVPE